MKKVKPLRLSARQKREWVINTEGIAMSRNFIKNLFSSIRFILRIKSLFIHLSLELGICWFQLEIPFVIPTINYF